MNIRAPGRLIRDVRQMMRLAGDSDDSWGHFERFRRVNHLWKQEECEEFRTEVVDLYPTWKKKKMEKKRESAVERYVVEERRI